MKTLLIIFAIIVYLCLGIVILAIFYKLDGTVYLYENDIDWVDFFGVIFWPMVLLSLGFNFGYIKAINFLLNLLNKEETKNERNDD